MKNKTIKIEKINFAYRYKIDEISIIYFVSKLAVMLKKTDDTARL